MGERELALTEVGTNEVEIMVFYLDVEDGRGGSYRGYFGVNVAKVLKIMRMPEQTMSPPSGSHHGVIGAFHFKDRDCVVPLIGLARYLDQKRVDTPDPKVIITEFNQVTTAFVVTGVTRIHRLTWSEVEPPGRLVDDFSKNAFTGVIKIEDRVIFILDLEKVVLELNPDAGKAFFSVEAQVQADRNVQILHVDDQATVRTMVKHALEQNDAFSVHSAESGQAALDWLHKQAAIARDQGRDASHVVDVVVTDVEMPVMDGYTLCKSIKDDPQLGRIPVFLFSSLVNDETMHKGASVNADGQYPKPKTGEMAQRIMNELASRCIEDAPAED